MIETQLEEEIKSRTGQCGRPWVRVGLTCVSKAFEGRVSKETPEGLRLWGVLFALFCFNF